MEQIRRINLSDPHRQLESLCSLNEQQEGYNITAINSTRIYRGNNLRIRRKTKNHYLARHRQVATIAILLVQSALLTQGFVHNSRTSIQHNTNHCSINSRYCQNNRIHSNLSATKEKTSTAASSSIPSSTDSQHSPHGNNDDSHRIGYTHTSALTSSSNEASKIDNSLSLNNNNHMSPIHSPRQGIRINGHQFQKHNNVVTNPLQFQQLSSTTHVKNNNHHTIVGDAVTYSTHTPNNGELHLNGKQDKNKKLAASESWTNRLPTKPILDQNSEEKTKDNNNTEEEEKNFILKSYDKITSMSNDIPSIAVSVNDAVGDNNDETQLLSKTRNPLLRIFNKRRGIWKRIHARSVEEGIRRITPDNADNQDNDNIEKSLSLGALKGKREALSSLLKDASEKVVVAASSSSDMDYSKKSKKNQKKPRRFGARTIAGLISALAEEASGLEVEVDARANTPIWGKKVDSLKINFSRLGCRPLRVGGLDGILEDDVNKLSFQQSTGKLANRIVQYGRRKVQSLEEAFNELDKDNSGALDEDELAEALSSMASNQDGDMNITPFNTYQKHSTALSANHNSSGTNFSNNNLNKSSLKTLASRLVNLYDTNGDGVVDREEYKNMVDDMEAIQKVQLHKQKKREQERVEKEKNTWMKKLSNVMEVFIAKAQSNSTNSTITSKGSPIVSDDAELVKIISKNDGSIVLSDLKLDMTRFVFGAIPILKKITLGGPLILEPFTFTATGSFNTEDILNSGLLDDGLRRLVARALRRRVRGIRDLLDGAVFNGRTWNTASREAPFVEAPELTSVEFDSKDRMIITGRAKIKASPGQPFIEQSFKLRTKLGTRENGQYIRLKEPELAFVVECPKALERHVVSIWKTLFNQTPVRPDPLYSYFPLVSPLKQTEADGFNLGEDNRIKSIYIKNGALRFTISAVLRPGRFLGNHYLALTFPTRTFILTMDRVKDAIRIARLNKLKMDQEALEKRQQQNEKIISSAMTRRKRNGDLITQLLPDNFLSFLNEKHSFRDRPKKNKSRAIDEGEDMPKKQTISRFFFRFIEGYLEASSNAVFEETHEERKDRVTTAITEVFGSSATN